MKIYVDIELKVFSLLLKKYFYIFINKQKISELKLLCVDEERDGEGVIVIKVYGIFWSSVGKIRDSSFQKLVYLGFLDISKIIILRKKCSFSGKIEIQIQNKQFYKFSQFSF